MVIGYKTKILIGLFVLGLSGGTLIDRYFKSASAPFASLETPPAKWDFSVPQKIFIPRIGLSAQIITAEKQENTWEVHPRDVNYGTGTAFPGTSGNTVLFAHRRRNLFVDLNQAVVGDQIFVSTDTDFFGYQIVEKFNVNPTEPWPTAVSTNDELTLFTCDGVDDGQRLIVKARPI